MHSSYLAVPVGRSSAACLRCQRPHLQLQLARARRLAELPSSAEPSEWVAIELTEYAHVYWRTDKAKLFVEHEQELQRRAVWTTGADERRLADACLVDAAERLETSILTITKLAVHAIASFASDGKSTQFDSVARVPTKLAICSHGIFIDGQLCTSLTYRPDAERPEIGVFSVPDLLCVEAKPELKVKARLPIAQQLLEAARDEPTLSYQDVMDAKAWDPPDCKKPRKRRRWAHLVLVSHTWGGTANEPAARPNTAWLDVQSAIKEYVTRELAQSRNDPRMKAKNVEDFGFWVDFMMVPHHAGCDKCERDKAEMIQRINALLTVATIIPLSKDASDRGWILQEMSLDARGKTPFEHRDRVQLMARRVRFSSDLRKDIDDGLLLRCSEFVRLALTPRVWPCVGEVLLEKWLGLKVHDESGPDAADSLLEYARSFDKPCHELKRMMASFVQTFALKQVEKLSTGETTCGVSGSGEYDHPFELSPLARAIEDQGGAMKRIAARIREHDLRTGDKIVRDARSAIADLRADLEGDARERLKSALAFVEVSLENFPQRTDPDDALGGSTNLEARVRLTEALQWQQFVAVAMGLRAEYLYGAGLACWVRASAITEALGATKFMARLKGGQARYAHANSITVDHQLKSWRDRFKYAERIVARGVSGEDLAVLYELGKAQSVGAFPEPRHARIVEDGMKS